ncbi:MAG: hypothetical protein PUK59_01845 [Actinomycetaceae bacterium]|nr:hypothetical protein [Actinomycetaceae bacterium]MDY5853906.1 hypothetical protein [Arcanobacterium sp.]
MGIIRKISEEEIASFTKSHDIVTASNFVVAREHRTLLGKISHFLASTQETASDAASIRILLANNSGLYVINPDGVTELASISPTDTARLQLHPWDSMSDFKVKEKSRTALISWDVDGQKQTWEADISERSIFPFNVVYLPSLAFYANQMREERKNGANRA